MTRAQINAMADRLGLDRDEMPGLVADERWVYEEIERETDEWFRSRGITGETPLDLTPTGMFNATGDVRHLEPLLRELEAGTANAATQRWFAGAVRRGRFKSRGLSIWEKADALGPLYEAAELDVPDIARLLRERGRLRGAVAWAKKIAALHHRLPLGTIDSFLKRGRFDRKRLADA